MKRVVMVLLLLGCGSVTLADTGDGGYLSSWCSLCYSSNHNTGSYKCTQRCTDCGSGWHKTGFAGCPKKQEKAIASSSLPQIQSEDLPVENIAASHPKFPRSKYFIKQWKTLSNEQHINIDSSDFRFVLKNFRAYSFKNAYALSEFFTAFCCTLEKAIMTRESSKCSARRRGRISTALVQAFVIMYGIRKLYLSIDEDISEINGEVPFTFLDSIMQELEGLSRRRVSKKHRSIKKEKKESCDSAKSSLGRKIDAAKDRFKKLL